MQRNQTKREEKLKRRLSPIDQLHQIKYVPRALRLVWQAAHGWTMLSTLLLIIRGILPAATVYLTKEMVNDMVNVVNGNGDIEMLLGAVPVIALMAATILARELIGDVQRYVSAVLADRTQDFMYNLIHEKTTSLDMQFYESTSYFDKLQRASSEAVTRPLSLLESINGVLENTITLFAMIGILFTLSWWIPIVLLLGTLPALAIALRTTRIRQTWRLDTTTDRRRLNYYKQMLSDDKSMPELRIFGLGQHFKEVYSDLRQKLREEGLAILRRGLWEKAGAGIFGLATLVLMLGWMGWSAFEGMLDLGEIVMFWQAMNNGRGLVRSLFYGFDNLYNDLIFLDDLFTFLELKPQVVDSLTPVEVPSGLRHCIEVKNITFTYPESELIALKNFSLVIPREKVVAIVGENGAGKSTLTKLLCRFYDPQEGRISWDGVDLRDMAQEDLRRRITILFQRPLSYLESVEDNIRFGDLENKPTREDVIVAAKISNAHEFIRKFPQDYDTVLGKQFGKAELSVGEWQRVALARAFVRQADFVILDEPTSAMDSWTETQWMASFRKLVKKRTALIITHRFTTAMQADIIYVMVNGRIIESGSHAELISTNSHYAKSWRQQMQRKS